MTASLVDADIEGYVDYEVVSDLSQPYNLKIVDVVDREVEVQGITRPITEINFVVTDSGLTNPKMITYALWHPHASQTPEQNNTAKGKIIRFKEKFGTLDSTELKGLEARAFLKLVHPKNKNTGEEYPPRNEIKKFAKDE